MKPLLLVTILLLFFMGCHSERHAVTGEFSAASHQQVDSIRLQSYVHSIFEQSTDTSILLDSLKVTVGRPGGHNLTIRAHHATIGRTVTGSVVTHDSLTASGRFIRADTIVNRREQTINRMTESPGRRLLIPIIVIFMFILLVKSRIARE